jgi:hypothetical protein
MPTTMIGGCGGVSETGGTAGQSLQFGTGEIALAAEQNKHNKTGETWEKESGARPLRLKREKITVSGMIFI